MLGVYLKSLGAGYSRKGREEDALRLYDEAGRLYPGLPDAHFNAGVSLQKLGRLDEAAGKYRRALRTRPGDGGRPGQPEHPPGREGAVRGGDRGGPSGRGARTVERRGAGEPRRRLLRLRAARRGDPRVPDGGGDRSREPEAQEGLERAYFSNGSHHEAAAACDLAESLGCRFDPPMLRTLSRYREGRAVGVDAVGEPTVARRATGRSTRERRRRCPGRRIPSPAPRRTGRTRLSSPASGSPSPSPSPRPAADP